MKPRDNEDALARLDAQTARMFLMRAVAQAEDERRREAQLRLNTQTGRTLPRDDR